MNIRTLPVLALVAALLLPLPAPSHAQLSLDPKDWYNEMKVGDDSISVVKDMANDLKFYYLPSTVRLAEYTNAEGKKEPHFQLVKYQVQDPNNKEKLLQAAIMQFSITLEPQAEHLAKLREDLAVKYNGRMGKLLGVAFKPVKASDVLLTGVPMTKSRVRMYSDDGSLVSATAAQEGIGPTSTTTKMPFTVKLTDIGAKVFEAMFKKGNVGWPVNIDYEYKGLTPRCGFKVTVDWKKTYTHYSRSENKTEVKKWSYWIFGSRSRESQTIMEEVRDKLIEEQAIKIDLTVDDSSFTLDQANKYLEPIIKRINDKLLQVESPKSVDPAKATKPTNDGGTATNISVKDVNIEKLGTETVDMNVQFYQTRTAIAAGSLTLGKYGDEKTIGDKYVVTVPYGNFEYARFSLPAVSDAAAVGITGVSILCKVTAPAGIDTPPQQEVSWNREKGWGGRTIMMFPLMKLYEDAKKKYGDDFKSKLGYDVTYTITYRDGRMELPLNKQYAMFDGEFAFQSPFGIVSYINMATVDPDDLWNKKSTDPGIEKVEAKVSSGGKVMDTLMVNSRASAESVKSLLVDAGKDLDVKLKIVAKKALTAKADQAIYEKANGKKAAFDTKTVEKDYNYKGGAVPKEVYLEVAAEDWLEYYLLAYVYDEEVKKPVENEMSEEQKKEMDKELGVPDTSTPAYDPDDDWF